MFSSSFHFDFDQRFIPGICFSYKYLVAFDQKTKQQNFSSFQDILLLFHLKSQDSTVPVCVSCDLVSFYQLASGINVFACISAVFVSYDVVSYYFASATNVYLYFSFNFYFQLFRLLRLLLNIVEHYTAFSLVGYAFQGLPP